MLPPFAWWLFGACSWGAVALGPPSSPASHDAGGAQRDDAVVRVAVVMHVVSVDSRPVVDEDWLHAQLRDANRLFAPIGVEFVLTDVGAEAPRWADLRTRSQRDRLGRGKAPPGAVHVFVVERLADVDHEGAEIRGVHWRDRNGSKERWIILSSIASSLVLAHELGHFFGLPHSGDVRSIMNKRTGPGLPPWHARTFLAAELQRMARARDRMVSRHRLVPVAARSGEGLQRNDEGLK